MNTNWMKCPEFENHTKGFETGSYGTGPTLNGERIQLTGSKKTHNQLMCEGCGLYWILEPVEK